jgi:hypothetical protein
MTTTTPIEFWKTTDNEERQLRVFISHRFGGDKVLYDDVILALNKEGFSVQDLSLSEEHKRAGPRGGQLPKLAIQAEVAARIYTSDVVIAPGRPAVSRSEWVMWEVQLAAIGYSVPVLFVKERNSTYQTTLVTQLEKVGAAYKVCEHETPSIVSSTISLVGGRPRHAVRLKEEADTLRFRGPSKETRDRVMLNYPYRPALAYVPPAAPPKRNFLAGLFGRSR